MDVWRVLLFVVAVFLAIRAVVGSAVAHRLRTLQKLRNEFETAQRSLAAATSEPVAVSSEISNPARSANVFTGPASSSVRLAADTARSNTGTGTSASDPVRRAA